MHLIWLNIPVPEQQIAALENIKQTWIKCQQRPGTSQQPNVHTPTKQLLGNTRQDAKPFHTKDDLCAGGLRDLTKAYLRLHRNERCTVETCWSNNPKLSWDFPFRLWETWGNAVPIPTSTRWCNSLYLQLPGMVAEKGKSNGFTRDVLRQNKVQYFSPLIREAFVSVSSEQGSSSSFQSHQKRFNKSLVSVLYPIILHMNVLIYFL